MDKATWHMDLSAFIVGERVGRPYSTDPSVAIKFTGVDCAGGDLDHTPGFDDFAAAEAHLSAKIRPY